MWKTRQRQLIEMRVAESNRLTRTRMTRLRRNLQIHLDWLDKQIRDLDQRIRQLIASLAVVAGEGPIAAKRSGGD